MSTDITIQEIKERVPKSIRANITQELTDNINNIMKDPDIRDEYRENILGYTDVLQEGKWKFGDYITAIKYVGYKLRGDTNMTAYTKSFPERIKKLQARGVTDFSSWVVSYGKSKLVNEILSRSMIPTHILNADVYQKAINIQAQLMVTANSEKVRTDAANSLLNHLKPPETAKIEIDMNVKQQDGISDLTKATLELVKAQKLSIESGARTARDIAHSAVIVEGELVDG